MTDDDAPPGEAVEVMAALDHAASCDAVRGMGIRVNPALDVPFGWARTWVQEATLRAMEVVLMGARRTLPAAARWRLVGWLAADLEPTEAMLVQAGDGLTETGSYRHAITAALAAAREARDG